MTRFAAALVVMTLAASAQAPPTTRALVDGTGASVTLPAKPSRIIALAPELAELSVALGAGDALVGRCDGCDRPSSLDALPSVGPIVQPSIERILALRPDLVLASSQGNPLESLRRLRDLGVPVFGVASSAKGMAGIIEEIGTVGAAVGHQAEAEAVAAELQSRLAAVKRDAAARPRVRACLLV